MHPGEKSELYRIMSGICTSSSSPDVGGGLSGGGFFLPESIEQAVAALCGSSSSSSSPFYGGYSQGSLLDTAQARALRNHKEAEKRRRVRINSHLHKLRSILPACSSKTDKATLLAKVVDRVRELKQEAMELTRTRTTQQHLLQSDDDVLLINNIPSESDEVTVYSTNDDDDDLDSGRRRLVFKATLCCEDRSDLLPDLMGILKSLRLKTLRAEMSTVGGRIRNVLIVAADKEHSIESLHFLQSALKGLLLVQPSGGAERSERRRIAAAAAASTTPAPDQLLSHHRCM